MTKTATKTATLQGGVLGWLLCAAAAGCSGNNGGMGTPAPLDAGGNPAQSDTAGNPAQPDAASASERPRFSAMLIELATAFELPDPASLDEKQRTQGPLVASGDIPVGHGGLPEPSLLLQFLKRDAPVRSAVSGTVINMRDQMAETCDSEIFIIPDGQDSRNPTWVVGYDHVKNVKVAIGQHVKAGDQLGTPGSMFYSCDGPGRVELQINHQPTDLAHCPLGFFDAATRATIQAGLRDLMTSWNTRAGATIYDQAHLDGAGCLTETTKP